MAEWYSTKLNSLCNLDKEQQREEALAEIKINFKALSPTEAADIADNLDLSNLFHQLTSNDKRVYPEPLCDALSFILQASEPHKIFSSYHSQFKELLSAHNVPCVKASVLKELLRGAHDRKALPLLLRRLDLIVAIMGTVADGDVGVARLAMNILKKIGQSDDGLMIFYIQMLDGEIQKLLSMNDTIKFRVYEIIVDIVKQKKGSLQDTVLLGLLDDFTTYFNSDNILAQLNALELLRELASTKIGFEYMEKHLVLDDWAKVISDAGEMPPSNILIQHVMKFFGNLAHMYPDEILSRYPGFIRTLFKVFENKDPSILAVALDTLGYVASTAKGKHALQKMGMPSVLQQVKEIIEKMPMDLKLRGLNCMKCIFSVSKYEKDNKLLSLVESWFHGLAEDPLLVVCELLDLPFADIRQACLEFLLAIASQEWAQEYFIYCKGLMELLLDRSTETFKTCKEVKFEIVKTLSEAGERIRRIYGDVTMKILEDFVKEGPFYIDTNPRIQVYGLYGR